MSHADAVKLARVCANESTRVIRPPPGGTGGGIDTDCMAIMQVVHDFAAWKRTTHSEALRRLAPYVTGTKPAKKRRHAVFASLPAIGWIERPALWDDARDGAWSVHGPLWALFRNHVRMMTMLEFMPMFPGARLVAWGCDAGPECDDTAIAKARGLVRVDDGETYQNSFWALPSKRALSAAEASGGRL